MEPETTPGTVAKVMRAGWLGLLLSGPDNQTPAIGRVLGALICIALLLVLPGVVVGALMAQGVKWDVWAALFSALTFYVPAVIGGITALIRVTNPTEPQPGAGQ